MPAVLNVGVCLRKLCFDRQWNRYWLLAGPRASAPRNRGPLVCVELRPDPLKASAFWIQRSIKNTGHAAPCTVFNHARSFRWVARPHIAP